MPVVTGVPRGVILASLVLAFALLGDAMLYAVLPVLVEDFGVRVGLVGVLLSANRFIRLISNPMAVAVYTRFGVRGPLVAAVALAVGSTAAYGLVHGFWPLLAARVLWGVSFSFLRLGGYLVVLEEGSAAVRGQLMGFFNAVQRSGNLVGVTIGAILADLMGHESTFLLFAAVTAIGLPLALSRRPARRGDGLPSEATVTPSYVPGRQPHQRARDEEALEPAQASSLAQWRLGAVGFIRFAIAFSVSGLVMSTLGLHLRGLEGESLQLLGLSLGVATVTGLLLGSRWAFSLGLATHLGMLSDRIGRSRVILGFATMIALALATLGTFPILLVVTLVLPLLFLATVACEVTLDASVGDMAPPERRAQTLGWYTTWADLGMALGPLLGYGVVAAVGLEVMYLAASGLLVTGLAVYALAFRVRRFSSTH